MFNPPTYIMHYASEYYDPVKAHEYYMRNRQLKGRSKRVGTLNEKGQAAKQQIKDSINEERNTKLDTEKTKKTTNIDQAKSERDKDIETYSNQTKGKIDSLKSQIEGLRGLSKEERANKRAQIQEQINILREDNANKKAEIRESYKSRSMSIGDEYKTTTKSIREDYRNRYNDEVDRLYTNQEFLKPRKRK